MYFSTGKRKLGLGVMRILTNSPKQYCQVIVSVNPPSLWSMGVPWLSGRVETSPVRHHHVLTWRFYLLSMNCGDLYNEGFNRKDLDETNSNVYPCNSSYIDPKRISELKMLYKKCIFLVSIKSNTWSFSFHLRLEGQGYSGK